MSEVGRFGVYGRMTALPGRRDALIERFADLLRIGVPGLESFSVTAALDDADTIWVTQIWTDRAAHDRGTRSDLVVSATERVMSLVAGAPQGSYGQVVAHFCDQGRGAS